ncbi:hypothetical protein [Asticcacaulis sp. EMRT-3]|uniref:hypothetical protein n=1 Tax=Asticcacaulis sp. EMRT-3 TaxID=3040349 RepID=UPI0024AE9DB5|nr:hypothetical protein [Asticcacaulis sp. EMRT-3]MDI7774178.1 hypothetical protein [Asticcacaulis sp. EMRT-3]
MFLLMMSSVLLALAPAPAALAARAAPHHKAPSHKTAAHKTTAHKTRHPAKSRHATHRRATPSKSAQTEAKLRDQTDSFVSLIKTGQQDLTDAHIAWTAQRPLIACQRARSAQSQFGKAQDTVDSMVKIAEDDKADTAPLKALYPKTSELHARAQKLIGLTCIGG